MIADVTRGLYHVGMGLDGVELIMEIEGRFGVRLKDHESQHVRTVADLAALIISKRPRTSGTCPTAHAFYEFRRLAVAHGGVPRSVVRPSTTVQEMFGNRFRASWNALRRHDRRLPRLVLSGGTDVGMLWVAGLACFAFLMGIAVIAGTSGGLAAAWSFLLLLASLMGVGAGLDALLRRHLPDEIETVGDVVHAIADGAVIPGSPNGESPGERLIAHQRVLEEVRRITAAQLGLPIERVTPDADFVKDLHLD